MRDREPDSTGADCPAETLLLAFASGGASSDDRRVVEAHLSTCDICRMLVSALAPTHLPRNEPSSGPASAVAVGEILAGKYEILRVIGEGGMGQVLEARHLTLECSVALKLLHRSVAEDREAVMRFLREARAAAALDSDHVVRVLDAGTLPHTEEPYVVLEYLNGSDLSKLIRDRGPLPIEEAVGYVLQACEALSLAHARGIVHRDIKPANLFLTQKADGSALVKVLDFGIAKIAEATPEPGVGETSQNAIMGSPRYMAPEQLRSSKHVDARADIWAMGVTLFELLGGRAPFVAESVPALCAAIFTKEPPSLSSVRSDVPEPLSRAVMASLEKEPNDRTASMADFARALAPFAGSSGAAMAERARRVSGSPSAGSVGTSVSPIAGDVTVGGGTTLSSAAGEHPNPRSAAPSKQARSPWPVVAAAAVLVGGLVAAWNYTQGDAAAPAGAPSSPASDSESSTALGAEPASTTSAASPTNEAETAAVTPSASASATVLRPSATRPVTAQPPAAAQGPIVPPPFPPATAAKPASSSDDLLNRKGLGDRK